VTRIFEISPWVPPAVAARMAHRSPGTIQTWMRSGELASMCALNGTILVCWHDVRRLTFEKTRRLRGGTCKSVVSGVKWRPKDESVLSA